MRSSLFLRTLAMFSVMTVFASVAEAQEKKVGLVIRNDDNLRLYAAPRVAIEIVSRSVETEIVPPPSGQSSRLPVSEASDSSRGHEFDVIFGSQYRLRDRLALFGETGLAYRRSTFPTLSTTLSIAGSVSTTGSEPESRTTNVGLRRSAVGLVLFF